MVWVGIGLIVLVIFFLTVRQDSAGGVGLGSGAYVPPAEYVRKNDPEMFYEIYGTLGPASEELARFVEAIAKRTELARRAEVFPIEAEDLKKAASAFSEAALEVFGVTLDLHHHDPEYIDTFINQHLIDPKVRAYFEGPTLRELEEGELEAYEAVMQEAVIADEPLLFYALGAYWGEWLVLHKNATWTLFDPLRLPQTFPDGLTSSGTMCSTPFSHGTKKLSDPEGDQLSFKALSLYRDQRLFGPHPLLASIADAQQAALGLLPEKAREAQLRFEAGQAQEGLAAFEAAVVDAKNHPRVLNLAANAALMTGKGELARNWLAELAELQPDNLAVLHNLAAVDSQTPEKLPEAIEMLGKVVDKDPSYARARITLASCLVDAERSDEARAQLEWVKDNDPELAEEAEDLLAELRASPAE